MRNWDNREADFIIYRRFNVSIPSERAGEFADVGLQFKAYFVWHCPGASGVSGDKGPTGDAGE